MKGHPVLAGLAAFLVVGAIAGGIATATNKPETTDEEKRGKYAVAGGVQLLATIAAVAYAWKG